VIIEHEDHRPLAVIHALRRSGRPITEILTEARKRNSTATLDEDFGKDLEEIIASHRQPWQPPSWDGTPNPLGPYSKGISTSAKLPGVAAFTAATTLST
jgi:hypothetical protein